MTIPNYDQEIERRGHPENFEEEAMLCTNCDQPIGQFGVMSPTMNKKRRNMCLTCAKKIYPYPDLRIMEIRDKFYKKFVVNNEVGGSLEVAGVKADEIWDFIEELLLDKDK